MPVKKDLQLIVCPCVFEPRALARRVSTFSSSSVLPPRTDPLSSVVSNRSFPCLALPPLLLPAGFIPARL